LVKKIYGNPSAVELEMQRHYIIKDLECHEDDENRVLMENAGVDCIVLYTE